MPSLLQEYKASLKDISVEEPLDLYLFRPISFFPVKLICKLPVTPNQISFLSIIMGILAGVFFAMGNPSSFIYAGLLFGLSHILDVCDGMVARLKKTGTPTGRIIDGVVDYVNAAAVYTGLGIGLSRGNFEFSISPWLLIIFSVICSAFHSTITDYYRNGFLAHALKKTSSIEEDVKFFSSELNEMKQIKGKFWEKLIIKAYLKYSSLQIRKTSEKRHYDPETYYKTNKFLLYLWNCFGASTHITVLMVSAFIYAPSIFFYYTLGVANIGVLILWFIQVKRNKAIAVKAEA